MKSIGFMKTVPYAMIPTKAHWNDLGFDLYASESITLEPNVVTTIPTGIAVEFPLTVGGIIKDRSSIATRKGIFTVAGVIDPAYQGEILVAMFNPNDNDIVINQFDKIAQLVLIHSLDYQIAEITKFSSTTSRGTNGFGSSGS